MIARSLAIAALGIVLYSLLLFTLRPPGSKFPTQNQWQKNRETAESYCLDPHDEPVVIVGSSLSARMPPEELGPDVYNLSFSGGSALTGLELIRLSGRHPRLVVIEANILGKREDQAMIDELGNPAIRALRRCLPALREQYHPVNYLCGHVLPPRLILGWARLNRLAGKIGLSFPSFPWVDAADERALFPALLASATVRASKGIEVPELAAQFNLMERDLAYFQGRGVRCAFLQMPTDPRLMSLRAPRELRAALRARFPEMDGKWIEFDTSRPYETSDGSHLVGQSLVDVSREVGGRIREMSAPAAASAPAH